ncbi:MAG TPA: Gfo/Idh/MocA family oxidoreductase [Dehalococcoidia bacterium]|nr:Gfo/Idh/MocA family oxidoreductase [Dehalococcoidia bacterium]
MGKSFRVGVIGLGAMGKNHVRVYSELPDVELAGIADVDSVLTRSLAKKYHTKPFSDYKQLLQEDLDAVSIVVPTSLHREVALAAADASTNMLIEKPVADSISAAKSIIEAAGRNHLKLMIGHIERFNPVIPIIKKEIEGTEVSLIEITRIGPFPPRIKDVGVIIDLATHDIDLLRYITGSEFKRIHSLTSQNLAPHEDAAILLFQMENGILGRVTVNWLTPFKVREINIATKEKFVKASLIDQKVTTYSKYKENESYLVRELGVPSGEPLKLELGSFIDSIKNGTQSPISGEDGLKALDVAMECLSSG